MLLKHRSRTRKELIDRLTARGIDPALAAATVGELERLGLTGDRRYAQETVRLELSRRPASDDFLEHRLTSRGIAEPLAEREVHRQTADQTELDRALELARRTLPRLTARDQAKRRMKLFGVLARRGFDAETAARAVETVLGATPESFDHTTNDDTLGADDA
jgi:regulatory protein